MRAKSAARKATQKRCVAEHRVALKLKCVDHSGGSCLKCGYKECMRALTFHHLDPSQKEIGIGGGRPRSWPKLVGELLKTLLLCCRCHAELHDGMWTPDSEMVAEQSRRRDAYVELPIMHYKKILREQCRSG